MGPGIFSSKAGQTGLCLLALAAASGGLFMQQGYGAAGNFGIGESNSFLEKKEIALGRAGQMKALLVSLPPRPSVKSRTAGELPSRGERPDSTSVHGMASWYGGADGLHGAITAGGELFDETALTAAHRTLPFGTKVRVTFLKTGKSVIVRINDRGPYVAGRIIDISRAAAVEIGLESCGVGKVKIEFLP